MKKITLFLLGCAVCFSLTTGSLAEARNNVIAFPSGYDTESAGASAAKNMGDYKKSPYFSHLDFYNMKSKGSLVLLEKFKTYQQTTEWSCGNATVIMVLNHFGNTNHEELAIAKMMDSTPLPTDGIMQEGVLYGTTTRGIQQFFKEIGYDVQSSLDAKTNNGTTFSDPIEFQKWITSNLKKNNPIMVDWLDWSGHWQAIIGYDTMGTDTFYDDVIIFADPYDVGDQMQDGYYIYPAIRFFYMWQDFQFQEEGNKVQQWVIASPKKVEKLKLIYLD